MTAVGESDPNLASKCLDFCQALSSQGVAFNFSVSIGSTFSFSLDTRGKAPLSPGTKKKSSPSTLRRNARRRKEFLEKKQHPAAVIPREEAVGEKAFLCDQCDSNFKSENGLKIHVGKTHKKVNSTPSSPENLRGPGQMRSALSASPLLNTCREESTINPDVVVGDLSPPKSVRKHICPSFLCSRYQCPNETEEQKRHYQKMQELLEKGSF